MSFYKKGCHGKIYRVIWIIFALKVENSSCLKVTKEQNLNIDTEDAINDKHDAWWNQLLPAPNRVKLLNQKSNFYKQKKPAEICSIFIITLIPN